MKMTKEQVKEAVQFLVMDYKETGDEESANQAFELLNKHEWSHGKKRDTASKLHGTIDDAVSLYAEQFTKALHAYNDPKAPFVHFVNKYISWAVRDEGLKVVKMRDHELREGDKVGDFEPRKPSDLAKAVVGEHTFTDTSAADIDPLEMTVEQKQAKQLEVLAAIMEKASDFEKECAILFVELGSYRKVAAELGTNQVKVLRAIDRLSRYYEGGDVTELFTVTTTKSR